MGVCAAKQRRAVQTVGFDRMCLSRTPTLIPDWEPLRVKSKHSRKLALLPLEAMTVIPAEPLLVRGLGRSPLRHLRLGQTCQSRQWLFAVPLSLRQQRTYAAATRRDGDSKLGSYEASLQAQQARALLLPLATPPPHRSQYSGNIPIASSAERLTRTEALSCRRV